MSRRNSPQTPKKVDYNSLDENDDDNSTDSKEKKIRKKGSSKEDATIKLEDDEFYKKWAGFLILGPFVPAVFALIIIVAGQLVLNTWEGTCGYSLNAFISCAIAVCYMFLLVYSWVFIGDNVRLTISSLGIDWRILMPFKSLRWLGAFYTGLFGMSFIVWIVGTVLLQLSIFCVKTAPVLYQFSNFLVVIYWIFFVLTVVRVGLMFCGTTVAKMLKEGTREATLSEVEEKLFRQKFGELDTEVENRITREDVPKLLSALGVFVPEAEQKALIGTLDPEETGFVKYRPMFDWFQKLNAEMEEKMPAGGGGGDDDDNDSHASGQGRLFGR